MDDPQVRTLSQEISEAQSDQARRSVRATKFVKAMLSLLGGTAVAVAGAFLDGFTWPLSPAAVVIICGSLAVVISGIFELIDAEPPAQILDTARKAIDRARDHQDEKNQAIDALNDYHTATERLTSLYLAALSCRGVIEQATDAKQTDIVKSVEVILESCSVDLRVAMNIPQKDHWTVCVYQTLNGEKGRYLQCVAADRRVKCSHENARQWPEGIGIGGVALARRDEVIVPDVWDVATGSVFQPQEGANKPHDQERYRSMCAIPIMVGNNIVPWGVVVATSSTTGLFGQGGVVDEVEAIRMLSAFCALLVTVHGTTKMYNKEDG